MTDGKRVSTIFIAIWVITSFLCTLSNAAPINDKFDDAIELFGGSGIEYGTNVDASGEIGEPDHDGLSSPLNSIWFKWTASSSSNLLVTTLGSDFDTTLAVYTGNTVDQLTYLTSNDDYNSSQSGLVLSPTSGTTYYIAVDGYGPGVGNVQLNWSETVTISGTFSMPAGVTVADDFYIEIYVQDPNAVYYDFLGSDYIMIPTDGDKADWSINLPKENREIILKSNYWVWDGGFNPGSDYVPTSYYNSSGTVGIRINAETFNTSVDHTGLQFPILQGNLVSGEISLPFGDSFTTGGWLGVKASWGKDWQDAIGMDLAFSVGETRVPYSIAVPPDAPPYQLSYNWWSATGQYATTGYYDPATSQAVFCASEAGLFTPQFDYPNTDLTFLKNESVSGLISLPSDAIESEILTVSLGTIYKSADGEYSTSVNYPVKVEIPAGELEVPYQLGIVHDCRDLPGTRSIGYKHTNNNYVNYGYYNSTGTVGLVSNSESLPPNQNYSDKNLQLLRGKEISGKISLPAGESASESGLAVWLGAVAEPDGEYHNSLTGKYHHSVTIDPYENSTTYSFRVAPDMAGIALGYGMPLGSPYATQGYFSTRPENSPNNVSGRFDYAHKFDPTMLSSGNDFVLDFGHEISGTVSVPSEVDNFWLPVKVTITADPEDPEKVYWDNYVYIPKGATSTSYSTRIILDSDVVVQFSNTIQSGWEAKGYYLNETATSPTFDGATWLDANRDHTLINLIIGEWIRAKGDYDGDGLIDLRDVVIVLKILSGMPLPAEVNVSADADVDGDGFLSFPEIIFLLNQL